MTGTKLFCTNCGAMLVENNRVRRNDLHVCDPKYPSRCGILRVKTLAPALTYNREREAAIIQ